MEAHSEIDFDKELLSANFITTRQRLYAVALVALVSDEASSSDVTESLYSGMISAARGLGLLREADAFKREAARKDEAARFASCHKAARDIVTAAKISAKEYGMAIAATLHRCNGDSAESRATHLMRHMLDRPWGTPDGAARIQQKSKKAAQRQKARDMAAEGRTRENDKAERAAASLVEYVAYLNADDARETLAALFASLSLPDQAAVIHGLLASLPVQDDVTPIQVLENLLASEAA